MQEKDLHKLGKTDLLTIIYKQEKQIQQLTKEVEELKQQLEDRTIQMKEAGSIAEASLKINKIFEAAQQAADEYLRSIKEVNKPSQECAEINGDLTKDETNSEISNNFQSKNTYDNKAKDKISKELVLVNNKIMVIKPKLLRRVVIFLMYIFVKIMPFIKSTTENIHFFTKKVRLNAKINFIKLKHYIIKIIRYIKLMYDAIKQHMVNFGKYCKLQFPVAISNISYKIYVNKLKQRVIIKKFTKFYKLKIKLIKRSIKKFMKLFWAKICCETINACKSIKLICVKIIQHMNGFIVYCNFKLIILRYKIRNIKSRKIKLLKQASETKETRLSNQLMLINYKVILYKIFKTICKYLKKELQNLNAIIKHKIPLIKNKCHIIIKRNKFFFE